MRTIFDVLRMIILEKGACSSPGGDLFLCLSPSGDRFIIQLKNEEQYHIQKKFFSHPGLQLSQDFPLPFPAERTTHPWVLVLPCTYLQLPSPALVLHQALPALQAPDPAPKLAFLHIFFSRPIPFPVGQRVGMCALTLQQILRMGRFCRGRVMGALSTVCAATEDPSRDGLLTETHHILSWPPQGCLSVGIRQGPWLDHSEVLIPISFWKRRLFLAFCKMM